MGAFDRTLLHSRESNIGHPRVGKLFRIGLENRLLRTERIYVTKRGYGWYQTDLLDRLCDDASSCDLGIIYMVRDPADVLTSRHRGKPDSQYYLEPQRWLESVQAGERLLERLSGKVKLLTIRYEELVGSPESIRQQLEETFDLSLRPSIESWAELDKNVDREKLGDLETALHSIRSFDAASIGKWKQDEELSTYWLSLLEGELGNQLRSFSDLYGYNSSTEAFQG